MALRLLQHEGGYRADSVVVLGRDGSIENRFALFGGVHDIALQGNRVIVTGGPNLPASDLVFDLQTRVTTPIPILQAGYRKLSGDGRYLSVTSHQDTIDFFDIGRTQSPRHLWRRAQVDSCPVVAQEISPTGRFLAYHAWSFTRRQVDLHVLSRDGAEVGVVRHAEKYPIDGLQFVDDRYLLEGVYGSRMGTTVVVFLYDLGAVAH